MENEVQNYQETKPDTPPTPEELEEMRRLTGEKTFEKESTSLPYLGFNADKKDQEKGGYFFKPTGEKDEKGNNVMQKIGKEMAGVIIKVRKKIESPYESKEKHYSNEFDGYNENIELQDGNNKNKTLIVGSYQDIKSSFPDIKLKNVLYIYSDQDQQVYKMDVRSGSLSSLWDYLKKFDVRSEELGAKDTVMRYITKFSWHIISGNAGEYIQMTFQNIGVYSQWKKLYEEVRKVNDIIANQETNTEEREKKEQVEDIKETFGGTEVSGKREAADDIGEEYINVDKIPF